MYHAFTKNLVLAACALLGLAAFQTPAPSQDPPKPAPTPAPKPEPDDSAKRLAPGAALRIAAFPGADKEKAAKQHEALSRWLSKDLNRPVEIVPVADSAAAIAGLLGNKLELAWLDGESALKAEAESKGYCWPMFTRVENTKAKSYVIAAKKHVDAGTFTALEKREPQGLDKLAALKPKFAALKFSFGAKTSIAAHWMPRWFLERPEAGVDPEKSFKQPAAYTEGGDAAVLAAVASASLDLGVVAADAWDKASDELKAKAPVIFVTPEYMDACMVVYNRIGPTLSYRVSNAFKRLDPKQDDQKAVLELFGTAGFQLVGPQQLAGLREVLKSAKERKLSE